jgi:hypothetical protein
MVANRFLVSSTGDGKVLVMNPPRAPLSREEAIEFAAWIVVLSGGTGDFDDVLQEVMAS